MVERGQQEEARIMKNHPETAAGEVGLVGKEITTFQGKGQEEAEAGEEEQENRDVRANVIELERWRMSPSVSVRGER